MGTTVGDIKFTKGQYHTEDDKVAEAIHAELARNPTISVVEIDSKVSEDLIKSHQAIVAKNPQAAATTDSTNSMHARLDAARTEILATGGEEGLEKFNQELAELGIPELEIVNIEELKSKALASDEDDNSEVKKDEDDNSDNSSETKDVSEENKPDEMENSLKKSFSFNTKK